MAIYSYKAKNPRGAILKGKFEADNKDEVREIMKQIRLRPIRIKHLKGKEKKKVKQSLTGRVDEVATKEEDFSFDDDRTPILGDYIYKDQEGNIQLSLGPQKVSSKDLVVFSKQFSTMLNSGVPLIEALSILSKQQTNEDFAYQIRKVKMTVETGSSLSDALSMFPKTFDKLYVAMVEAGEASGNLDEIMLKLISYIEKANKIKSQIKSASAYPVTVVVFALLVVTGLLLFVVPAFTKQFTDSGKALPGITQFVVDMSSFMELYWSHIFGSIAFFSVVFVLWKKTPKGEIIFDEYILKAPVVGPLLSKIVVGRFCSTLSSMLASGVNLIEALSICATTAGNKKIELFIQDVRTGIEGGSQLSEPLSEGGLFPDMVISMVSVGEATGQIDEMLEKISIFYEEEVDTAIQTMLAMIEPIMIVGIGGIIGFIVLAMYLPIFDLATTMG